MSLDLGNLLHKYLNPSAAPSAERHVRQGYAVRTLGSAALTIALAKMANRMRG